MKGFSKFKPHKETLLRRTMPEDTFNALSFTSVQKAFNPFGTLITELLRYFAEL